MTDVERQELQDKLDEMPEAEFFDLCNRLIHTDIFPMDDFNEEFSEYWHTEVIELLSPNFNVHDAWCYVDANNKVHSFNTVDDVGYPIGELEYEKLLHEIERTGEVI